ncbi:UvrD-helicase domain-containing protein, partial [Oleiphilus sp. HI0128]
MREWAPSEGVDATSELMNIITCDDSIAVLAGAGAGKTELLAQKASYLFYTANCPWPKRILSLTFKTEAQINIKERVSKRCGDKAARFDSFTFHALCKSIVDRFKNTLPRAERPINNYDIVFQRKEANGTTRILMGDLIGLAIRILRSRDDIRNMFASSYEYVFVDEFQDTTNEQYTLLKLMFQNTATKVLAVGDLNQSIMLWAGARQTIFKDFLNEFSAQSKLLVKNYRASTEIQNILNILLLFIQNPSSAISEIGIAPDHCSFHTFEDEIQEASFIVDSIRSAIERGGKENDICVLTKQLSSQYTELVREELTRAGINNLDMSDLQDALKEPLGQLFSLFLKSIIAPTPEVMSKLFHINLSLNKVNSGDSKEEPLTLALVNFISHKRELITPLTSTDELISFLHGFVHELGVKKIKGRWKQYKSPEYFQQIWQTLEGHLRDMCDQASALEEAVMLFSAENSVHLMNVHKCKGLEYDSVYFIGLEDQAFWNYRNQPFEDNCSIYVALSRAKEQIYVTYTKYRSHRINRGFDNRLSTNDSLKPVVDLL